MVIIKSSKAIRNGYKDISALCKATHEPVHLTVNGEGDLVVMDIGAFYRRERMLDVRAQLLEVEADRLRGAPDYPAREVIAEGRAMLRSLTGGTSGE
ncbi:MAG: prevent-host-death protein [Oscillospiraceae bacterium]|jgi:PHD/YefM family antitoxin component YafN of YafNO toxin-antitoxin module|nr:prevent-host-death protein [Oscillospiraceae bacterium]